jgi:hypothetical protein
MFKLFFGKKTNFRLPRDKAMSLALIFGFMIIALAAVYFWGNRSAGVQINAISRELKNHYEALFSNQEIQIEKYRRDLEIQAEDNSYDRIRMGDATNILLALQNYNFENGNLPDGLKDLAKDDFYNGNLTDPESGGEYFYKKIDSQNYILCFYLSSGIWGTNKNQCPAGTENTPGEAATTTVQ